MWMALVLPSLGLTCFSLWLGWGPDGWSQWPFQGQDPHQRSALPSSPTFSAHSCCCTSHTPSWVSRSSTEKEPTYCLGVGGGGREAGKSSSWLLNPIPKSPPPPQAHTALLGKLWQSTVLRVQTCYFPAGGLGQATQPLRPHLICANAHMPEPGSGREDTEIGPPHSSSPPPGPATQSPPTRAPRGEGGETHLGKLGDAPGSVRGRPAVRGPPAPCPSLLHGPQGAQLRPHGREGCKGQGRGLVPRRSSPVLPLDASQLFHWTNPY